MKEIKFRAWDKSKKEFIKKRLGEIVTQRTQLDNEFTSLLVQRISIERKFGGNN